MCQGPRILCPCPASRSIWDADNELGEVESLDGSVKSEAPAAPPATPAAPSVRTPQPPTVAPAAALATPVASVDAQNVPRPAVSASAVPNPPAQQQSTLADEMLPDEVAELAADREEKQVGRPRQRAEHRTHATAGPAMLHPLLHTCGFAQSNTPLGLHDAMHQGYCSIGFSRHVSHTGSGRGGGCERRHGRSQRCH